MIGADDSAKLFKGYGWFLIAVMLAVVVPEINHQHLNFSTFPLEVRLLSRWGILFLGLGKLISDIFGGDF